MDGIVQDLAGVSVVDALYRSGRSKGDVFDRTLLTHPAIFMTEYALALSLIRLGVIPNMVFGASLGSFAAAVIAGFLNLEDALSMVVRQAQAFEKHCEPGGMIAVLADPVLYREEFLSTRSALAGVNFASHFIVSAPGANLHRIEQELRVRSITNQRLPVSFAFHSEWIDAAAASLAATMQSIQYRKGTIPLFCCAHARALDELPPNHFWNVVRRPIQFREAVEQLERAGPHRYIDVGPAGTLATFLKYGLPTNSASTVHATMTPYGRDLDNLRALTV